MWERKIAQRVLVGKTEGGRQLERPWCRSVNNKNLGLQETGLKSVE